MQYALQSTYTLSPAEHVAEAMAGPLDWVRSALRMLREAVETEGASEAKKFEPADVQRALCGDENQMGELIRELRPVVQAEVAWTLERYAPHGRGRDTRQEVLDMVQEVFVALLENEGRVLNAWDPNKGRSLRSFVKLVARHQVISILRSSRRCPWQEDPTPAEHLSLAPAESLERRVAHADQASLLMAALRAQLSTKSMLMFEGLYVEERSVDEVCAEFGMTREAVYAWRTRLRRRVQKLKHKLGLGVDDD